MMIDADNALDALDEPRRDDLKLRPRSRIDDDREIKVADGKRWLARANMRDWG
jgi:hypothetical protein